MSSHGELRAQEPAATGPAPTASRGQESTCQQRHSHSLTCQAKHSPKNRPIREPDSSVQPRWARPAIRLPLLCVALLCMTMHSWNASRVQQPNSSLSQSVSCATSWCRPRLLRDRRCTTAGILTCRNLIEGMPTTAPGLDKPSTLQQVQAGTPASIRIRLVCALVERMSARERRLRPPAVKSAVSSLPQLGS